jgi:pimeloyl-ACP methyl ester carboxylesterase
MSKVIDGGAIRRLDSGATYLIREPEGDAGVVVFVHGLGSSGKAWEPVLRYAPEQVGFVIPDLPGFGSSPRAKLPPLEAATDMVVELLRNCMGRSKVTVVAHSVGGIVAMKALNALDRERPDRLVLVSGTLESATHVLATSRRATESLALTAMVGIHVLAGVIPLDSTRARLIARHRSLRAILLWPFLCAPQRVPEEGLEAALPHHGGRESLRAVWSARHADIGTLMANTSIKTQLVYGLNDPLIRKRDIELAHELLKPDETVALDGCGHWPHIERPEQTAALAFAG